MQFSSQATLNIGNQLKPSPSQVSQVSGGKNLREQKKAQMLENLSRPAAEPEIVKETETSRIYNRFLVQKKPKWEEIARMQDKKPAEANEMDSFQIMSVHQDMSKEDLAYELSLRPRRFIIRENSSLRYYFNILIIFLAVYVVCIQPYLFAFDPQFSGRNFINVLSLVIDGIFLLDIVMTFRTTYINNQTGDEIWSPAMIAKNYLFSIRFYVDIVSCLPFDFFTIGSGRTSEILTLISMLKFGRFFGINRIIQNSNLKVEQKAQWKVGIVILMFLLFIHIFTCLFFYIIKIDEAWISPVEFIYRRSLIFQQNATYQYFITIYYGFIAFGVIEVAPRSNLEISFIGISMIFSAMLNAYIFGIFSDLIVEIRRKSVLFNSNFDTANTSLSNLLVPKPLQEEVRKYITSTFTPQTLQEEMIMFLETIPPSLKKDVSNHIFSIELPKNDQIRQLFMTLRAEEEQQQFLADILEVMSIQFVPPEEVIINQGDDLASNPFAYLIEKGECKVTVKDKHKLRNQDKSVRSLYKGDMFGEIAIICKGRRTCSVTSTNFSTLGRVHQEQMLELFAKYPQLKSIFIEKMNEYDDVLKLFFEKVINTIDYLQGLPTEILNELIFSFIPEIHEKDTVIFKQEDIADRMYIVQNGMVEIFTMMDNAVNFTLERLYRGSVINHRSFLLEDSIDLGARCATQVSLYYLTLDRLSEIKKKCPELNDGIKDIEDQLVDKENAVALDYVISKRKGEQQREEYLEQYRNSLTVQLKNAVMFYVIKYRELRRIPKFKDIMMMAIEKKKKEMQAARRKQNNMLQGNLNDAQDQCDEDQFSLLNENIEKINKSINDSSHLIEVISKKLNYVVRKKEDKPRLSSRMSRMRRNNSQMSKKKSAQLNHSFDRDSARN